MKKIIIAFIIVYNVAFWLIISKGIVDEKLGISDNKNVVIDLTKKEVNELNKDDVKIDFEIEDKEKKFNVQKNNEIGNDKLQIIDNDNVKEKFKYVIDDLDLNKHKSIYYLVNKKNYFPGDYIPQNLIIPNVKFPFKENLEKKYMRKEAALALEKLFDEAKKQNLDIYAISGYRSYKRQESLYKNYVKRDGKEKADKYSAVAGSSEHQSGLVMDISNRESKFDLLQSFGNTKEGKWVKENAHKYGFIIRYAKEKENITKYMFEPWHLRYLGEEVATFIYENNLAYEEFFDLLEIPYNK